ncbi:MAG TPA: Zn-dependent alcohol dehydrogenase [Thermoanaerobaculia bacterium]|nr:Zn-dependent alcohol dehydrogenase [Thermoanaerobaculia bacterium]
MKAAVCHEFGQPLRVEEVELDAPRTGEVRVRLAAAAVCHSDLHLMNGDWSGVLPIVPGHEAAGVVEEIGENVTLVKKGDRVVVSLLRTCGRCAACNSGASHNCDAVFALDRETRVRDANGNAVQQGIKVGAFAEAVIVDQSQCVRIPEAMPFDRAALLGCGVITGTGAVLNTARVEVGESVAVIGCGGVGLNIIQGAALAGAHPIIALDRIEAKLDVARAFGATQTTMEPKTIRNVDYAFVAVGNPNAVTDAMRMIRRGGTVVVVGMPGVRDTAPIRIFDVVWSEQHLIGSRMGGTRLHTDIPRLVDLYLRGRLKLDELISGRYSLEQSNEAIAGVQSGEALRNVIVFA